MMPKEYWRQDAQHQDQKFYTAFCLLGSACNDYAVGIDLRNEKKLNWAVTAFYYSLMHCGRLACFIAYGDFPTGHGHLNQLFATGKVKVGRDKDLWMGRFRDSLGVGSHEIQPQKIYARDDLVSYFVTYCRDVEAQFPKWGQILSEAKELRESSNYEGLLIAHASSHILVTPAFENLVRRFSIVGENILAGVIPLMRIFVDAYERREQWYAFLNWKNETEGLYYLEDSLLNKVNQQALRKVTEFLSPLRKIPDQRLDLAGEVRESVKVGVFGVKTSLMDGFQAKIRRFEKIAL